MKPNSGGIFDFDIKSEKLEQVNAELEDPNVWNDPKRAQDLGKEKKSLEAVVNTLTEAESGLRDANDLFAMAREENDDDTLESIEADTQHLRELIEGMEFRRMFNNPMDPEQLLYRYPGRCRWYRGAGLGIHAAASVSALLRAQRL